MSSTYIPPHLRNRKPATCEKKIVEADFPEFVAEKNIKKYDGLSFREKVIVPTVLPPMPTEPPRFLPIRTTYPKKNAAYDVSDSSEDDTPADDKPVNPNLADGEWKVVERKVRVKRDKIQEALDNEDAPLEDEEEDQSLWDEQPEEYETYWDRKP
jgi:hypothetical protein